MSPTHSLPLLTMKVHVPSAANEIHSALSIQHCLSVLHQTSRIALINCAIQDGTQAKAPYINDRYKYRNDY